MDLKLQGKRVLITGATAGIGRAAAMRFADERAELVLAGRSQDKLSSVSDSIKALGLPEPHLIVGDLTQSGGGRQVAQEAMRCLGGSVDVLINNAGASAPLDDPWDEAAWDAAHRLNFVAARDVTSVIVPDMVANGWGRIVNITGAMVAPSPNAAAPAKAALQSWSRTLAIELASSGVTVNTIAPGRISTDQINNRLHPTAESRQAFIDRFIPAGYFGEPDDLACLVVFLASPLARYINGAAIPVDGAMLRIS